MYFYALAGMGFARGYDQYAAGVLGVLAAAFSDARFELDVLSREGLF